ncbi:hypothetical protein chiPu_0014549 [Chiloscyllium punctatum]|uniref:Uncharacterized protein n=1 Tax=Chiloscyllium punctatum TaxID=137246 RepID=A0A401T0B1_CHIPU|nr:hypothetical protein [Chiloscyllium punctatum]
MHRPHPLCSLPKEELEACLQEKLLVPNHQSNISQRASYTGIHRSRRGGDSHQGDRRAQCRWTRRLKLGDVRSIHEEEETCLPRPLLSVAKIEHDTRITKKELDGLDSGVQG